MPANSVNTAFQGVLSNDKCVICMPRQYLQINHGRECFYAQSKNARPFRSVLIDSFATSTEEIGNPPHRGTVNKLREVGIPLVPHRAKQITWADYEKSDYIIGMDSANMRNLNRMLKNDPEEKLYKFLTFAGSGRDIADPWYTGNFDETYEDIQEGCEGFLDYLEKHGEIHY